MKLSNELNDSLKVSVKIDHNEILKVVIWDLIEKRNCPTNEIVESFDDVLRYYLGEEDFYKYVIKNKKIGEQFRTT